MGWCSATSIFDSIVGALLDPDNSDMKSVIRKLTETLEANDWDCQFDSRYIDHPVVKSVFKELHPHWFKNED